MLTKEVADIIIPLHVLTDSDHTSGFYAHGIKQFLEKVMKDSESRKLLGLVVFSCQIICGRTFVLSVVYNKQSEMSCGEGGTSKKRRLQ